jgi:hypothetical protein
MVSPNYLDNFCLPLLTTWTTVDELFQLPWTTVEDLTQLPGQL